MPETDIEILCRIFKLDAPDASQHYARWLLNVEFTQHDVVRVQFLLDKGNQGTISPEERAEQNAYTSVGDMLNILHAKAHLVLKNCGEEV